MLVKAVGYNPFHPSTPTAADYGCQLQFSAQGALRTGNLESMLDRGQTERLVEKNLY